MENTMTKETEAFNENNRNLVNVVSEGNENNYQNRENSSIIPNSHEILKIKTKVSTNKLLENTEMQENNEELVQVVGSKMDLIKEKPPDSISLEKCESRKKRVFIDSDSEEELQIKSIKETNIELAKNTDRELLNTTVFRKNRDLTMLDDDSENESINVGEESFRKRHKRITRLNTDSESEDTGEDITPHDRSFNLVKTLLADDGSNQSNINQEIENIPEKYKISKNSQIHERLTRSDSEPEDVPHGKNFTHHYGNQNNEQDETVVCSTNLNSKIVPGTEPSIQKSRLAMLCDSDSDEEPSEGRQNGQNSVSDDEIIEQSQHADEIKTNSKLPWLSKESAKKYTKKTKTKNSDEGMPKKMNPKQAAELRKEIQSESQRMIREKNISLPYHKPKTHSLKEFLARRPKLSVTVPTAIPNPPSVAIKMSTEQLQIISKKLKEREKEVKEFYKSESESENDDTDYLPPIHDMNQSDEETKEASKIEQDQDNNATLKEDNKCSSNLIVDNIIPVDEDNAQGERRETHPLEHDNTPDFKKLPENVGNATNDVQPEEDTATTSETIPEYEPMETNSIAEEGQYIQNFDQSELEGVSSSANLDDNTEDNQYALKVNENLEISEPDKKSTSAFVYTDQDVEIENFENSDNVTNGDYVNKPSSPPILSKLDILKERLAHIKPRLSGKPDEVIDLNSELAKPKEVTELMERFAKHVTSKKHNPKNKVKLSIVTVESGGDIHKETVAVNVDNDDETEVQEEKPGAKLQRLREELQKQMDQRKSEIWQQKAAKGLNSSEETHEGGKDNEEYEKDNLCDDDEEAEMTSEEDSEEDIENDIELLDKPLKKSEFVDEEAEESDEEEIHSHKEGFEEDILNEEVEKTDYQVSDNDAKCDEDSNMSNEPPPPESPEIKPESSNGKRKTLKRIIKPVDDSDDDDIFTNCISQNTIANEHLDSTVTADEEDIPPHQTRQLQTPMRQAISQAKSISDFLTPISFITSIQNLTSATKNNKYGPVISPFRMPQEQSPSKEERPVQKILFNSELMSSQGSLDMPITQSQESLADLGQNNDAEPLQETQQESNDEPPNTQDLMGICSGEFTGITQLEPSDETRKLVDDGSQSNELKSLDQDMVISQLLDEEELENFKKKFESPLNPRTQYRVSGETQEITGGGIIDSDDENIEEFGPKRKKNQRRIQFSEDESSDEETVDTGEEIDLEDKDDIREEETDNIGYDSEENEIDLNDIGKKEKIKLTDFVDAEAELSESEWGSDDEDENDMDKLEFELGDTEKFDEDKLKEDLEKIHMRRMLDNDAREIKLLQEVLLEDGEMHGTGRQRQFRWKNIDSSEDLLKEQRDDDEIYLDEEESEEQWRKKRHEREMFLKEKQELVQNRPDSDLLNKSQLLKIGQKVLQRSQNNSQNNTPTLGSPIDKTPFSLLSKRGSFLGRGDQVLQRVAEYTKISTDISVNSSKTAKNFVFQSISASEVTVVSADKKRKASDGTPKVLKKLRLTTNLSPAVKAKSSLEKSKKLFNF